MKYLVTGAAGFIGARVSALLLEQGHHVLGVDNLNDYYDVRLKKYRLEELNRSSAFSFLHLDIEDGKAVSNLFEYYQIQGVLNLAARAGVRYSMENPFVYLSTNALGTLNLLESMVKFNVKKMVLASTSSLYARQKMPFSENLPVNTPISPYAASKKAAESFAYSYHHLYDLDISVVRYFTVYGPGGRPDMSIFRFIRWIDEGIPIELFGDGSQSRDFTYVDDAARGTVAALKGTGYEIYNIGGGKQPISLNNVIVILEARLGKASTVRRSPVHRADMSATWAEISKASRELGWRPQIGIEEGIRRTVDWHLDNREWINELQL